MPNLLDNLISQQDIAELAAAENLTLEDEIRIGVLKANKSIDVQACPGSGKTTLIAAKLILLAKKWSFEDRGICVLSHTNVAKDEIIRRLEESKSNDAVKLLNYPHFIGTIQEFVGKYVAFPYLRSKGYNINLVDTESCVKLIHSRISNRTRAYVERRSQYSNVLYDFNLQLVDGKIKIDVPTFPNGSKSLSYRNLRSTKINLLKEGYFFYRDVYAFAEKALATNTTLHSALRKRFPYVFIDEMQDTQKFQDDLLRNIFPLDSKSISVQRFGDPDQAIFQGIGSEEPNESFNGKSVDDMDHVIHKSHRFSNNIASKISNLSFNQIPLQTELKEVHLNERRQLKADGSEFQNVIFVFDNNTVRDVVPRFADVVAQQFEQSYLVSDRFTVKAIGAVGNDITSDTQLKIGHYCPHFSKSKSIAKFKESTLIEAVYYCRNSSNLDWADNYSLLLNSLINLLRSAAVRDQNDAYFNQSSLKDHLSESGDWSQLRRIIQYWLNPMYELNSQSWDKMTQDLITILNIQHIPNLKHEYLAFGLPETDIPAGSDRDEDNRLEALTENAIQHPSGFKVDLSTIHGVKGETHDATLILETKNYCFDLGEMLSYVTKEYPNDANPNSSIREKPRSRRPNMQFMRQFYVGMSRPKHLLGLAIHTDRISEEQRKTLVAAGWVIENLIKPES